MDWKTIIAAGEQRTVEFKSGRGPLPDRDGLTPWPASGGDRRSRTYHLSAEVYREMGEPAAYVRRRGFERPQMEQMILQYVDAHGKIARRDVMELCRVDESQAWYLLSQLVEKGQLQLVGKGRGAHYVAAER